MRRNAKAAAVPGANHRQQALLRRMPAGDLKHVSFDSHLGDHGVTYLTARKDLEDLLVRGLLVEKPKEGKRRIFAPAPGLAKKLK